MKFKRITAVITAAVMALSMVTAASAEDNESPTSTSISEQMSIYNEIDNIGNNAETYATSSKLDELYAEYPDGSYYTYNKKACTCHTWCDFYSDCNCIKYDASSQCVAFAKYVFYNLRGKKWSAGTTTQLGVNNVTATTARNALQGVPEGTYVLVDVRNSTSDHALSIISTSANGVTVYDANSHAIRNTSTGTYYGNCQVRYKYLTWVEFANQYSYIYKTVT